MLARRLLAGVRAVSSAARPAPLARCASDWLTGRPPSAADLKPNTVAHFYYENIRNFEPPTKDFVVATAQDEKFNVSQFDKQVYYYAAGFAEGLGLKKGTKIATWMTNELENVVVQLAATLTGATVVSIDPRLPIEAVLSVMEAEDPRALIVSPRFPGEERGDRAALLHSAFYPELERFIEQREKEGAPIESKRFPSLRWLIQTGFESVPGVQHMQDLAILGDAEGAGESVYEYDIVAAQCRSVAPEDLTAVYYGRGANGADGEPTLVKRSVSQAALLASAAAGAEALGLKSTDSVVITAPLHSQAAFAAGALAVARAHAKFVIPSKTFDAAATLQAITQQRATHVVCTPEQASELSTTLAQDAAAKKEYSLDSLRGGLVVGLDAVPSAASIGSVALRPVFEPKLPGKDAFSA